MGLERDPRLKSANIIIGRVADIPTATYDVIIAIDVIEHVVNDIEFLRHIVQVATRLVVIATPNWLRSRCVNPFHYREYTPLEFEVLLKIACAGAQTQIFIGTSVGEERRLVQDLSTISDTDSKLCATISIK